MPQFRYEATDANGTRQRGALEATNAATAATELRARGLVPIDLRRVPVEAPGWGARLIHRLFPVPPLRLAQFCTELASLLRAGVNAHEAMDELAALAGEPRLARMAGEIAPHLAAGASLAEQLARYPALLPPQVAAGVRAGEQVGALPEVLASLGAQFTAEATLEMRLRWVRRYYALVLVVAVLVAPFPLMIARGMAWYGDLLLSTLLPALFGAFVLLWLARTALNLPVLARVRTAVLQITPVFGPIARWSTLARFLETLGLAQRAGLMLDRGLALAGEATGGAGMARRAHQAGLALRHGASLAVALAEARVVPARVREMLAVGERAGDLDASIAEAARWAAERRDAAVASATATAGGAALAISAIIVTVALALAWRNYYDALFERAGV